MRYLVPYFVVAILTVTFLMDVKFAPSGTKTVLFGQPTSWTVPVNAASITICHGDKCTSHPVTPNTEITVLPSGGGGRF